LGGIFKYIWERPKIDKFFSKNIKVIFKITDKIFEGSSAKVELSGTTLIDRFYPPTGLAGKNQTVENPPPAGGHGVRLRKEYRHESRNQSQHDGHEYRPEPRKHVRSSIFKRSKAVFGS
jgi:hypothetical protein